MDFNDIDLCRNNLKVDVSFLFDYTKTTYKIDISRTLLEFNLLKAVFPKSLTSLDLNHNKIFKSILKETNSLSLQLFNVSYNRLCGKSPV
ncbi:hypothetical protein Dsin_022875, partial [Dipteronia sinensis]